MLQLPMATTQPKLAKDLLSEQTASWIPAILALILFSNTLGHGYALDDVAVIVQNKFVQQGIGGIPEILTTFYWKGFWDQNAGLYRPLSLVMFATEHEISGPTPFLHHLVQVLLYAAVVTMLYKGLRKYFPALPQWQSLAITLLFTAHPIHTEVVANIKSRDELLAFLFMLTTAFLLLREKQDISTRLMSCGTFLLALLSKEASITFLAVFFLLHMHVRNFPVKKSFLLLWPLLVVTAAWLAWRYIVVSVLSIPAEPYTYADNSIIACNGTSQLATGIFIFGLYAARGLWPSGLSYDYSFNQIPCREITSPEVLMILSLLIALVVYAWKERHKMPLFLFGLAFFLSTISISANVLFPIGTTFGERLLFTPVLGLIIMPFALLNRFGKNSIMPVPVVAVITAILLASGIGVINRNRDWKSDQTLFKADGKMESQSARKLYNHATALLNSKDPVNPQQVTDLLNKAVSIDTGYYDAWVNLGVSSFRQKNYTASIEATRHALKIKSSDPAIKHNLADAYMMSQQYDSAITYLEFCIDNGFTTANTYNYLGTALFSKQRYTDAIKAFELGIKAGINTSGLWLNYGNCLAVTEQFSEAIKAFERAYQLDPSNKQPLYFLAITYEKLGDVKTARSYMTRYNTQP